VLGVLCLKRHELCLDTVSTVRGSGWVNDQVSVYDVPIRYRGRY